MIEQILYLIFGVSGILIAMLITLIFIQKLYHHRALARTKKARNYFYKIIHSTKNVSPPSLSPLILFQELFNLEDQVRFSPQQRANILDQLPTKKMYKFARRNAKSLFSYRRVLGSQQLAFLRLESGKAFLLKRLKKEKHASVKFYIFFSLLPMLNEDVLSQMIDSLKDANKNYVERATHLLRNHYSDIKEYLNIKENPSDHELYCYLTIAKKEYSFPANDLIENHLADYLALTEQELTPLKKRILFSLLATALLRDDPRLSNKPIINHDLLSVRKYAYQYLVKKENLENIELLLRNIQDDEDENKYITTLIQENMSSNNLFDDLVHIDYDNLTDRQKKALASVMSSKIDYLIISLNLNKKDDAKNAISFTLKQHKSAGLIAFINRNKDREIEQALFTIIHPLIEEDEDLKREFTTYVNSGVLLRQNLEKTKIIEQSKEKMPLEIPKIIWMISILFMVIITYPLLSLLNQQGDVLTQPFFETFKRFILDTNHNLIYYFMSANIIYFLLLSISLRGAKKQRNLWAIKSDRLLYEEDILDAISIIAPAYNEELSIITSVQSLLNLKYPSYEVVVVNDGSKDQTLQKLIDYFDLKREDANKTYKLKTKAIRGIYRTSNVPNLVVVNKVNGGKADALNVGINIASHPYVCGIDADSVLEQEALLRLMSITLDHKNEPVALGGNIIPANGCTIDHGYVEETRLPKELIPRFQSLEYLRAFTSGRIGWSSLDSLLIISGAFGLFNKSDIIKIGGYITSSGVLNKDSVGEDMELVVRLTHQKLKHKEPYLISYVYHANCYTELPSDIKTLLKQRNRWHRGLIDILSYHRKMFLRPKYKQIGLFAFPYFYIFEVMGPFFEMIGYLALITSFALGFLAPLIVLGIFGVNIVMGIVLSLSSLYISETVKTYTTKTDVFMIILFAIIENIGYRQMVSLHRVYSFFTALFESGTWGEQKRKGI